MENKLWVNSTIRQIETQVRNKMRNMQKASPKFLKPDENAHVMKSHNKVGITYVKVAK